MVQLIIGTVVALLPIANPIATAPIFLAVTEGDSKQHRAKQARMAATYMFAILVAFLLFGSVIMTSSVSRFPVCVSPAD